MKLCRVIEGIIKISTAQLYVATFGRRYLKRNIWIVGEKKTEARDNGYHFFKYLCREHPELEKYYIIKAGSPDSIKVKKIGAVVDYDSFKHCVLYSAAKIRACSQIHGVQPFEEVIGIRHLRLFMRKDQRVINLKHGISKDFRPQSFDFRKSGFDLYISGAKPEYDAIKQQFNYPDRNIALTGFCRFDALHNLPDPEKAILIMPTFRDWLRVDDSSKDAANEQEMEKFKNSDYFKYYCNLLSDNRLLSLARKYGYKIYFYIHYTFQPYVGAFKYLQNDVITICGRKEYDVQALLINTAMLITDYSSVFFDYGYMMKPMLFYQFDLNEYRSKHYQEGYFSYTKDAFGPIINEADAVVDYVEHIILQNMKMDNEYKQRVETFFIPFDANNCERVYNAILKLEE